MNEICILVYSDSRINSCDLEIWYICVLEMKPFGFALLKQFLFCRAYCSQMFQGIIYIKTISDRSAMLNSNKSKIANLVI